MKGMHGFRIKSLLLNNICVVLAVQKVDAVERRTLGCR